VCLVCEHISGLVAVRRGASRCCQVHTGTVRRTPRNLAPAEAPSQSSRIDLCELCTAAMTERGPACWSGYGAPAALVLQQVCKLGGVHSSCHRLGGVHMLV